MVMRLPESDRISVARDKLEADLAVAMGGRIAEELIFGREKVTSGASSDIRMATDMARKMVTEWGMSEKLGPLAYGENEQEVFLGHSVTQTKHVSETTAQIIDAEIRGIVDAGYNRAKTILTEHIDDLHTLAKALLEYETLSGDEIIKLLKGEAIVRSDSSEPPRDSGPRRGSVPSAGDAKPEGGGGLEPRPQPGT